MESETLLTLNQDQWRTMDQIAEALSAATDLIEGLQTGLGLLLSALGRPGAALYLARCSGRLNGDWAFFNPPPAWPGILADSGVAARVEMDQAMRDGAVRPGNEEQGYAAIFPLVDDGQPLGALLVSGPVIPPEDYPAWQGLLRPFVRVLRAQIHLGDNPRGDPVYRELLRSRDTLRALFDNLPISIYIIDPEYTLAAINMSRADRTGEPPRQLVGRKCYQALYQRESPCAGCLIAGTFASGQTTTRVNRDWLDSDRFVEWEVSSFPIFDEHNAVRQAILVEQDITEKRNLEAGLIQSAKLAAVGQLAAGVAHEINNPLTAILANTQILKRSLPEGLPESADFAESVELIDLAGTRALQVVRNLLGIARKEKYEFEPVNVNESLRSALALTQHELVGRAIQLTLDLDDDLPDMVASQDQLQGVWINLILNAIDAIDKENGQIAVASHYTGDEIQVTFTDNGRGIPAEMIPRLFEPFFTTKITGRGTGLGLSVCLRAVHRHNGDIRVESEPGAWTRFTVVFPLPTGG